MSKNQYNNTNYLTILVLSFVITISLMVIPTYNVHNAHNAVAQTTASSTIKVQAGGGNSTLPSEVFYPKQVQIKTGGSITWYNPSKVPEPHTVTFIMDNRTKAQLSAPFAVTNSSKFMAVPPGSNSEPVLIPNHNNPTMTMILGSNARASNPTVIDSTGKAIHLNKDGTYSVKGDEKYINSGIFFPQGKGPPNASTSFTLTFEKAGTYSYYCILHPWMKGKVVVQ